MTISTQVAHFDPEIKQAAPAVLTGHGPAYRMFHRIFLAFREMNHASRRLVEVQAPWAVDAQWHSK
jgi:hypothetical protein